MNALPLGLDEPRIIRVIDLETSGLPDDEGAEIVEVGFVDVLLDDLSTARSWSTLVRPAKPITPKTMAVHHITNDEVAAAPTFAQVMPYISKGLSEHDLFCAHNAKFERHFLGMFRNRWVCTHKSALTIWPDFESHSNQACRYELGLSLDKALAEPPHRALPDAYVTAHILIECLKQRPATELVAITESPILLRTVGFGKHRGKTFEELARSDKGYLQWMSGQEFDEDVKHTVKHWLGR